MPDYKETDVTGKSWWRAKSVIIGNPYLGTPSIGYEEEECVLIGTDVIKRPVGGLAASYDPRNPLHVEIYAKLNELYELLRTARDQAVPVPDTP